MAIPSLFIAALLAAAASAAPAPAPAVASPSLTCSKQFLSALSESPKKATSFCQTFTKTKVHPDAGYPDFVFDYCNVLTWEDYVLDPILSTVCSTYIHATSTPKSASASSTKKSSAKATTTSKTTAKVASSTKKTTTSSTKKTTSSSTKKSTSSSTKKTTSSTLKSTSSTKKTTSSSTKKTSSSTAKSSSSIKASSSAKSSSSIKSSSSVKSSSSTKKISSSASKATSSAKVSSVKPLSGSALISSILSSVSAKSTSSSTVKTSSYSGTKIPAPTTIANTTSSSPPTSTLSAAPTATLIPVVHYDTDTSDLSNLIPQWSNALYYAEESYLTNPYIKHMYLNMQVNFTYPTVVTDHSDYLSSMTCTETNANEPGYAKITFLVDSAEAMDVIQSTWSTLDNLVLVTPGDGCSFSMTSNNTRSYWLGNVDGIDASLSDLGFPGVVTIRADEILTMAGITDSTLTWGSSTSTQNTTSTNITTTATTTKNGNSALCSQTSDPNHPELPHVNPCVDNFDLTLDQAIGLTYTVSEIMDQSRISAEAIAQSYPSQIVAAASAASAASAAACASAAAVMKQHEDATGFFGSIGGFFTGDTGPSDEEVSEAESVLAGCDPSYSQDDSGSLLDAVWGDLTSFVTSSISDIESFVDSWIPSIPDGTITINMAPSPLVDSPWGDAFLIWKWSSEDGDEEKRSTDLDVRSESKGSGSGEISVYCVDCGVKGELDFSGSASFSILDGLTDLNVGMEGYFEAGINLGIDAEVKYTFPAWSKDLTTPQGIPIFEVEGVIIIGPIIELKAQLELEVGVEGKVLTGATLSMPKISANFDLVNPAYTSSSGFDDIEFNNYFKAEGEISASATLSLPFSVGVGINIIPIEWDKEVKIVEAPGFKAEISYSAETSSGDVPTLGDGDDDDDEDSCDGIKWGLTFTNKVDFNFFDASESKIADYESPSIVGGCFTLGSAGNSSTDDYSNTGSSSASDGTVSHGTSMIDASGKYTVYVGGDGNLYIRGLTEGQSTYFAPQSDGQNPNGNGKTLVKDDKGRAFFIYPDTLATYGVSRIRALTADADPVGTEMVVFGFGDIDGNSATPDQYFIASDLQPKYANPIMPITCIVTDNNNVTVTKMFAVTYFGQDLVSLLTSPALAPTITGGVVSGCASLTWYQWQTQ